MLRNTYPTAPRSRRTHGVFLAAAALVFALPLAGCDTVLEVVDPDIITEGSLQNPAGLSALRGGAIGEFALAYTGGASTDGVTMFPSLLGDEWDHSGTFTTRQEAWIRSLDRNNGTLEDMYLNLQQARRFAENARDLIAATDPTDDRIGEMNAYAGYTYVAFAENWCGAVPFSTEDTFGAPETTAQILQRAIDRFTSALAGPVSTSIANMARIGMARAMLSQASPDYAAAAAQVASVPDAYVKLTEHSDNSGRQRNGVYTLNIEVERWTVADNKGGTGYWYRSANDPRLPWTRTGGGTDVGFDNVTPQYDQQIYTARETDFPLATGIEARLIEAEDELNNGTVANFLALLVDARAIDHPILGALTYAAGAPDVAGGFSLDLVDQGSFAGNLDLLMQERAFHMYTTGHRVGDMRRLIRNYGLTEAAVYPQGVAGKGLNFEDDVNVPITVDEDNNPNFTASSCVTTTP